MIPALIAAKLAAPAIAKFAAPAVASALPAASGMLGPIVTATDYAAPLLGTEGIGGQFVGEQGALPPDPQSAAGGGSPGSGAALPQMAEAPPIDLSRPGGGYSAPARRRTTIPRLNLP